MIRTLWFYAVLVVSSVIHSTGVILAALLGVKRRPGGGGVYDWGTTDWSRQILQAAGTPVLVDCWAPWCGPCRLIAPVLDQLAAESQGSYRIAKLNVDENPQTSSRFQIASIPTMLIFKDGKLIDRLIGVQPKQTIAERLRLAGRSVA